MFSRSFAASATRGEDTFRGHSEVLARFGHGLASSDDWPFIYLERPTIAPVYWKLAAVVAAVMLAAFALLRRLHPVRGLHAEFLLLGVGFTLIESSSIVRLALLFGATWSVNVVVFSACLLTVYLANLSVWRGFAPPLGVAWAALFASLALNWAFPLPWLFELGVAARVLACMLLVGLPVYCAGVCFSRLFERQAITGYALGINLIGAMAGGLLEYASMALGMRGVWLIALGVYALAFAASRLSARRAPMGSPT